MIKKTVLVGTGLLSVISLCKAKDTGSKPNVIFILTDDQADWTLGVSGNEQSITPNMDRLAKEGVYLKNAYTVTPVCSPSRASLITSHYGHELGITDWINETGKNSLRGGEPTLGLDSTLTTWPELFQKAGYVTGLIGKWHLGYLDEFHPTVQGYNIFRGFRGGGTSTKDPLLEIDGKQVKCWGLTEDILGNLAIQFINENKEHPFCLSLHTRAPHTAYLPVSEEDMAPYKDKKLKIPNPDFLDLNVELVQKLMPEYLASVRSIDRNLGRVLAVLDSTGLAENTIVILTSDHGYNIGHHGVWHKGNARWVLNKPVQALPNIPENQRPNMFDTSIKVPALIRWPGKIKPGMEVFQTITNLDWFPTLLSLAGIRKPKDLKISGRDFSPFLFGKTVGWNNDFYAEYSTHHQSTTHMRMYRTADYKLIRDFLNPARDEFYDLKNDSLEMNNLINANSSEIQRKIKKLHKKIISRMKDIKDPALKL